MKITKLFPTSRLLAAAGLLLAATASQAQNLVSFTIDMSSKPAATEVIIHGTFDGWGPGLTLTNAGGSIFSGTTNITGSVGDVVACKYSFNPGGSWEDDPNRQFVLQGGDQALPLTGWNDQYGPTNNVTFQVDMTAQIDLGYYVPGQPMRVTGNFKNPRWDDGINLTNNPALPGSASNIYSAIIPVVGISNSIAREYKFRANNGWESVNNRTFVITNTTQVLPLVFYDNLAPNVPTNAVTFQVDMTGQISVGNFAPGQFIRVAGGMNGWGDGLDLTNNTALLGNASNIYSGVINVIASTNTAYEYKFRLNGGYEAPTSTAGKNRSFQIAGGNQVLPLVFYSDDSPYDFLAQATTITYRLHITNGTPNKDGVPFVKGVNQIFINGEFNGWATWDILLPEMVPNPIGGDDYEYTAVVPAGQRIAQFYKFSIGGSDNEAGISEDHIEYVRTLGNTYVMPTAQFGPLFAATRVEQSFGNLSVGPRSGNNVPVTWLGRPSVTLQVRSSLSAGTWTDLPVTDSAQATNWPLSTGSNQFFRLQKRNVAP
jgi:hypothetical protein